MVYSLLTFKTLKYKNILSTGNQFTEIDFRKSKSTLIVGKNGSGKSTLLDALSFVLYGKPFRKINKPQLINSVNKKSLVVEVVLESGGNEYVITRGLKPNVFKIFKDGELINQDAKNTDYQEVLEKNILKLNHKSFSQIVVLGSSTFIPFMQLPAWHRREVIEDLLDLQIFSSMNTLLKNKISENKESVDSTKYNIDLTKEKIKLIKDHRKKVASLAEEDIARKEDFILSIVNRIEELQSENERLVLESTDLNKTEDIKKIIAKKNKVGDFATSFEWQIDRTNEEITFLHKNDNCPTCKQIIAKDFKNLTIEEKEHKISELTVGLEKANEKKRELMTELDDLRIKHDKYVEIMDKIRDNTYSISPLKNQLKNLRLELEDMKKTTKDSVPDDNMNDLLKSVHNLEQSLEKLIHDREILGMAGVLLKDGGIKTKIIRQYIPIMNKLINKYLAAMDFPCLFELDENFNEKIKSRFRDDFSYASFSEGEKLRIDIAILVTWRTISRMRNSISTNILIFDEIGDSSLDEAGFDEFLKIISNLSIDSNTFIISHKVDSISDKFENVIEFEKIKGFSRMKDRV